MVDDNSVLIGRKPVMNYVLACLSLFHAGATEVSVKARGKAISRAVDVAEVTKRRFMPDLKIQKIGIGTELLAVVQEGSAPSNVSTIEIVLAK
ncbi:MAG: DNA-binding protein Alba [Candidatus Bathyarchaeota archaeon]|nr:DNA-binding protein Alba [Candidatus Bathyarchaeum tardum]WNZ30388.1 MAG: DNA-binding protein Alba [Candidatus Bathyarchaeota archaeon]